MKGLIASAICLVVVSVLGVAFLARDDSKRYAATPDAARALLVGTTIPDIAFGMAGYTDPGEATGDGVQWVVERGFPSQRVGARDTVMILRAELRPVASGIKVVVNLVPRPGASPAVFDEHPGMAKMFRAIVMEQVDSVLTGRPFSFAEIRGSMALAVLSEVPNIRREMDNQVQLLEQRDRDTVHRAYDAAERR